MQAHLDFSDYIAEKHPSKLCAAIEGVGIINAKDLPALFAFLNQHPEITELDLKAMLLNTDDWQVLIKLLKANDTLLILHINSVNFRDLSKLAFVKALCSKNGNKKLEVLHGMSFENEFMQQVFTYRKALREKSRRKMWKELIQELRTIAQGFRANLDFIPEELREHIAWRLIDSYGFPFSQEQKKFLSNQFVFSRPEKNEIENSAFILMYKKIFGTEYAGDLLSNKELEDQSKEIKQAISKLEFKMAKSMSTYEAGGLKWLLPALFIFIFYPPQGIDIIKRTIPTLRQSTYSEATEDEIDGYHGLLSFIILYRPSFLSMFAAFLAWPCQHYYQSRVPLSTHKKDSVLGLLANFFGFKNYKPLYSFWGMLGLYFFVIPFHLLRMAVALPWSILKIVTEILPGIGTLLLLVFNYPCLAMVKSNSENKGMIYWGHVFLVGLIAIGLSISASWLFIGTAITSPFNLPRLAFGIAFSSRNKPQVDLAFNKYLLIGGGIFLGMLSAAITISFYVILWPLAAQALTAAFFPALATYLPSLLAFVGLSALTFASNAFAYFGLNFFRPEPTIFYTHDLDNRKPVKQFAQRQKQEDKYPLFATKSNCAQKATLGTVRGLFSQNEGSVFISKKDKLVGVAKVKTPLLSRLT